MRKALILTITSLSLLFSSLAWAQKATIHCPSFRHVAKSCKHKTAINGAKYLQCSGTYQGNRFLGFKAPTKPLTSISIVCNGIYCGEMYCNYEKNINVSIEIKGNRGGKFCHFASKKFKAGYDGFIKNCQHRKDCYFVCD